MCSFLGDAGGVNGAKACSSGAGGAGGGKVRVFSSLLSLVAWRTSSCAFSRAFLPSSSTLLCFMVPLLEGDAGDAGLHGGCIGTSSALQLSIDPSCVSGVADSCCTSVAGIGFDSVAIDAFANSWRATFIPAFFGVGDLRRPVVMDELEVCINSGY